MNRLLGTGPKKPKPTLDNAIASVDSRIESFDVKIKAFDSELSAYNQKMRNMREGPGKSAIKARALKVLRQKKQYESQRDQLQQQVFNMEQANMMRDNLQNTMTTVDALQDTTKTVEKQLKKMNVSKFEETQDKLQDLMDMQNDINESLSRAYDLPEDVDEEELDAELEAMGDEAMWEQEQGIGEGNMPGYMQDEVPPQFVDDAPETGKVKEVAGGVG